MLNWLRVNLLGQGKRADIREKNFGWNTTGRLTTYNGNGNSNGHAIDPETAELSDAAKEHLAEMAREILRIAEAQERRAISAQVNG